MMERARPARRIASAMEAPIKPIPMKATRSNNMPLAFAPLAFALLAALVIAALHEGGERVEKSAHLFIVADGDAQEIRQPITVNAARDNAVGLQESIGLGRRSPGRE